MKPQRGRMGCGRIPSPLISPSETQWRFRRQGNRVFPVQISLPGSSSICLRSNHVSLERSISCHRAETETGAVLLRP